MAEQESKRPGEGGTPEQGMQAGKVAEGDDRGKDRPTHPDGDQPKPGGTPEQGMSAGKTATGSERGSDRTP